MVIRLSNKLKFPQKLLQLQRSRRPPRKHFATPLGVATPSLGTTVSDRTASVLFCSSRSSWRPTPFGLPQGSVLGPLLYILFTAEMGSLLASCSLLSHSYADDVQAYKHCVASDARSPEPLAFSICLNPLKTQYIWLGTRQQLAKLDLVSLSHELPTFVFSTSVRDLGVILD